MLPCLFSLSHEKFSVVFFAVVFVIALFILTKGLPSGYPLPVRNGGCSVKLFLVNGILKTF